MKYKKVITRIICVVLLGTMCFCVSSCAPPKDECEPIYGDYELSLWYFENELTREEGVNGKSETFYDFEDIRSEYFSEEDETVFREFAIEIGDSITIAKDGIKFNGEKEEMFVYDHEHFSKIVARKPESYSGRFKEKEILNDFYIAGARVVYISLDRADYDRFVYYDNVRIELIFDNLEDLDVRNFLYVTMKYARQVKR